MSQKNVVLIGMPGSGKSTTGVLLAKSLGFSFVDTDLLIQQQEGMLLQDLISQRGFLGFVQAEEKVVSSLNLDQKSVISTGSSVISTDGSVISKGGSVISTDGSSISTDGSVISTDGSSISTGGSIISTGGSSISTSGSVISTGGSVIYSPKSMSHLHDIGLIIYLQVSFNEIVSRIQNISTRGIALKDGQSLESLYNERLPLYEKYADIIISGDGKSAEEVVTEIMKKVQSHPFMKNKK